MKISNHFILIFLMIAHMHMSEYLLVAQVRLTVSTVSPSSQNSSTKASAFDLKLDIDHRIVKLNNDCTSLKGQDMPEYFSAMNLNNGKVIQMSQAFDLRQDDDLITSFALKAVLERSDDSLADRILTESGIYFSGKLSDSKERALLLEKHIVSQSTDEQLREPEVAEDLENDSQGSQTKAVYYSHCSARAYVPVVTKITREDFKKFKDSQNTSGSLPYFGNELYVLIFREVPLHQITATSLPNSTTETDIQITSIAETNQAKNLVLNLPVCSSPPIEDPVFQSWQKKPSSLRFTIPRPKAASNSLFSFSEIQTQKSGSSIIPQQDLKDASLNRILPYQIFDFADSKLSGKVTFVITEKQLPPLLKLKHLLVKAEKQTSGDLSDTLQESAKAHFKLQFTQDAKHHQFFFVRNKGLGFALTDEPPVLHALEIITRNGQLIPVVERTKSETIKNNEFELWIKELQTLKKSIKDFADLDARKKELDKLASDPEKRNEKILENYLRILSSFGSIFESDINKFIESNYSGTLDLTVVGKVNSLIKQAKGLKIGPSNSSTFFQQSCEAKNFTWEEWEEEESAFSSKVLNFYDIVRLIADMDSKSITKSLGDELNSKLGLDSDAKESDSESVKNLKALWHNQKDNDNQIVIDYLAERFENFKKSYELLKRLNSVFLCNSSELKQNDNQSLQKPLYVHFTLLDILFDLIFGNSEQSEYHDIGLKIQADEVLQFFFAFDSESLASLKKDSANFWDVLESKFDLEFTFKSIIAQLKRSIILKKYSDTMRNDHTDTMKNDRIDIMKDVYSDTMRDNILKSIQEISFSLLDFICKLYENENCKELLNQLKSKKAEELQDFDEKVYGNIVLTQSNALDEIEGQNYDSLIEEGKKKLEAFLSAEKGLQNQKDESFGLLLKMLLDLESTINVLAHPTSSFIDLQANMFNSVSGSNKLNIRSMSFSPDQQIYLVQPNDKVSEPINVFIGLESDSPKLKLIGDQPIVQSIGVPLKLYFFTKSSDVPPILITDKENSSEMRILATLNFQKSKKKNNSLLI